MTKTKSDRWASVGAKTLDKGKIRSRCCKLTTSFSPLGSLASKKLSKLVDIWIPAFSKWESIFNGLPERLVGFGIFQIHKNARHFSPFRFPVFLVWTNTSTGKLKLDPKPARLN